MVVEIAAAVVAISVIVASVLHARSAAASNESSLSRLREAHGEVVATLRDVVKGQEATIRDLVTRIQSPTTTDYLKRQEAERKTAERAALPPEKLAEVVEVEKALDILKAEPWKDDPEFVNCSEFRFDPNQNQLEMVDYSTAIPTFRFLSGMDLTMRYGRPSQ